MLTGLKACLASPTGFPFKALSISGTLSDAEVYRKRTRCCGLGYLRQAYKKPDGLLGWRCPAENVDAYKAKGGSPNDTIGRKCLCNALLANIGLGTRRADNYNEPPLVTCGDAVHHLVDFLPSPMAQSYSAGDVVRLLLSCTASTGRSVTEAIQLLANIADLEHGVAATDRQRKSRSRLAEQ